jgi:4-hydroxymandelate oxidase
VSAELRQRVIAPINALSEVATAVGGRVEVYLADIIRRGIDVLKALALGAQACLLNDSLGSAARVGGIDETVHVFDILRHELLFAMQTCGVQSLHDIGADLVSETVSGRTAGLANGH